MARKFKCQDCGADIIVNFTKVGEAAICNSCENYGVVPETAVEVSEYAYNYFKKHGVVPDERAELNMPDAEATLSDQREVVAERPIYKLYSPGQIIVITYIATPMAGATLLAVSFGRLGRTDSARKAVIWGGVSTIALAVLAFFTPPNIPRVIVYFLPVVHTLIMNWIVNETYKKGYENHIARIGGRGSNWYVAGIGLLCLVGFGLVSLFVSSILALFIPYPLIKIP